MSTRIVSMTARQRPFPIGLDGKLRAQFSCNFDAHLAAPANWIGTIVKLLADVGISDGVFVGRGVELPTGDGPYVVIIDTGGRESEILHDGTKYLHVSAQIVVIASNYVDGQGRANAICDALDGIFNSTVAA